MAITSEIIGRLGGGGRRSHTGGGGGFGVFRLDGGDCDY